METAQDLDEVIKANLHKGKTGYRRFRRWAQKNRIFTRGHMDRYCWQRHDRIVKRYYPGLLSMDSLEGLRTRRTVEIGCGSGSASSAFAAITREVIGVDIDARGIRVARKRAACFEQANTTFTHLEPEKIVDTALDFIEDNSIILLYAVLEHMTEEERLDALSRIWNKMGPDNILIVGELPNRLCYFDEHTYLQPFLHLLPDYTFQNFSKIEDFRFAERFKEMEYGVDLRVERARRGLGCSFHEFLICFQRPVDQLIAYSFQEPQSTEEQFLTELFQKYELDIPIVFACQMMHFAVQKLPEGEATQALANRNDQERQQYMRARTPIITNS